MAGKVTEFNPASLARTALPVLGRQALRGPYSSGCGRGSPRKLGLPWMATDKEKQIQVPATHRHDGVQEEKTELPAQGLMGQEAGFFPQANHRDQEEEERRIWLRSAASASPLWVGLATASNAG